ncbi:hypothetical protein Tco_0862672 [Tanacetum coccineum]
MAQPWTTAEEITLCTTWCNAMDKYGTRDSMKRGFWSEVFANFEKEMGGGGTICEYDTIIAKWKHSIRPKVAAFSVVYDSVQRMDESGSSNLVLFQNALAEFENEYGHPFTMEACWRILKNHPAWTEIEMPSFNQRQSADEHEIGDEYLTDGYLTEKEQQQLLIDEGALRETLEEEARAKKEWEERIK